MVKPVPGQVLQHSHAPCAHCRALQTAHYWTHSRTHHRHTAQQQRPTHVSAQTQQSATDSKMFIDDDDQAVIYLLLLCMHVVTASAALPTCACPKAMQELQQCVTSAGSKNKASCAEGVNTRRNSGRDGRRRAGKGGRGGCKDATDACSRRKAEAVRYRVCCCISFMQQLHAGYSMLTATSSDNGRQ